MSKPFIIGITGGSGSGKTTFIKQLREDFTEAQICIISQDDYYFPRHEQDVDENGIHNFDLPKSIDKKGFQRDVERLIKGEAVEIIEYAFNNKEATPSVKILKPAPIIVVEGLFVFHYKKIRALLDFKVFFNAADHLKVIRRIKRDQVERNYPIEDVLYRYEHHVMPSYLKYIQPYMQEADIIINNNHDFNRSLEVLSGFLTQKLIGTGNF
jgi:uridine kinase